MNNLSCHNEFCIYQKQGNCILNSVSLDIQGNCLDCVYVNVEEESLNDLKEKQLKKLEQEIK